MKTVLLSALLVGSLSSAFAQGSTEALRQRSNEATRTLTTQLGLDEARIMQVRRLTYDRLQQVEQVEVMYAGDEAMRQAKLQGIADAYAAQLKGVLTQEQMRRYEQHVASTNSKTATAAVK